MLRDGRPAQRYHCGYYAWTPPTRTIHPWKSPQHSLFTWSLFHLQFTVHCSMRKSSSFHWRCCCAAPEYELEGAGLILVLDFWTITMFQWACFKLHEHSWCLRGRRAVAGARREWMQDLRLRIAPVYWVCIRGGQSRRDARFAPAYCTCVLGMHHVLSYFHKRVLQYQQSITENLADK